MTDNTKISVHDLAHSKGMPAAATEAMLLMQDRIEAQAVEIERLKREVMLQMGWKTEAQNEIERLLDYDEAKANALHNTLNQLANAEQEIERIKDRLGWICAVMDLDDEVTLQWIYTELQALRGVG